MTDNVPVGYWRKERRNVHAAVHHCEQMSAHLSTTPQYRKQYTQTLVRLGKVEQHFGNKRWVRALYTRMDGIRPEQTFRQGE